jgi:hypothetical protein
MVHDPPGGSVQKRNWAPGHPVAVAVLVTFVPEACGDAVAVVSEAEVQIAPVRV